MHLHIVALAPTFQMKDGKMWQSQAAQLAAHQGENAKSRWVCWKNMSIGHFMQKIDRVILVCHQRSPLASVHVSDLSGNK